MLAWSTPANAGRISLRSRIPGFGAEPLVMVIVVDLTTLAVLLRSYSAFTGVSLFSLMTFGESLFGIVIYYTRLETPIGAIARLKAFNETVTSKDREDPREDIVLDERWPQQELVELCGVSSRY